MFFWDSTYLILIPAIIISFIAQGKIKSTYSKYKKIRTMNGYTGEEVARMILDDAGLFDVPIRLTNQELADHYDPRDKSLTLSRDVYLGDSIAAAGIAAHEVGHAIQHNKSYAPLIIRNAIVPVVSFSSNLSWIIFVIGLLFSFTPLLNLGIALFVAAVIFQIITLPVEFNASSRALKILKSKSILNSKELVGAKKILNSAAMTYVAAAIMSILQLVRLIAIKNRND